MRVRDKAGAYGVRIALPRGGGGHGRSSAVTPHTFERPADHGVHLSFRF